MSRYYRTSPENSTRIGAWSGETAIGETSTAALVGMGLGVAALNIALYAGAAYVGYRVIKAVAKK